MARYGQITILLAAILFSGFESGCRREPAASTAQSHAMPEGPVFPFFDGKEPLPPSQWAETPEPVGSDKASELRLLHVAEVREKYVNSNNFSDGISAHPQWDPTHHFIDDLPAIRSLGSASTISVDWAEQEWASSRDKGHKDDLILPDGKRIRGTDLAAYLLILGMAAREGALQEYQEHLELSDSLLWIGYHIYASDTDIASGRPRILILGSAWAVAFELREHHARSLGLEAEAEKWRGYMDDLYEAKKEMNRLLWGGADVP